MKLMPIVQRALNVFPNSFINRCNEIILIPKHNVYFGLDDVESEEDFKCKMCEYVSRDCSYAMRYKSEARLKRYWKQNTLYFNSVMGTTFEADDEMRTIYEVIGNGIKHKLTQEFVRSGYNFDVFDNEWEK